VFWDTVLACGYLIYDAVHQTKRPELRNSCANRRTGAKSGGSNQGKLESAPMYGHYVPAQQQRKPVGLFD